MQVRLPALGAQQFATAVTPLVQPKLRKALGRADARIHGLAFKAHPALHFDTRAMQGAGEKGHRRNEIKT